MPRKELKVILAAALSQFPNDGFIIIRTHTPEGATRSNVDWISNMNIKDTRDVLRWTQDAAINLNES